MAGGWTAMYNMEDTGLLMSASAMASGIAIDNMTLRYRKHLAQRSTKASSFEGGGEQIDISRERRSGPANNRA
ncbi:hypothetical protein GCM10023318_60370 [Nocardia callitridis]|uniref:Uncharacterized protein n=2 Tax=Nocardia callitridis TaxID=648753 RepID=A0ABP9L694_9NOCA